jgi:small subunit ribosomal protein S7
MNFGEHNIKKIKVFNLLVGILMQRGNKAFAEKTVGKALLELSKATGKDGQEILEYIVDRLRPLARLRPRVVSGVTYKIPSLTRVEAEYSMALKWLVEAARLRNENTLYLRLFNELLDTWKGNSAALKKRDELHKLVLANRPFLKFLNEKDKD